MNLQFTKFTVYLLALCLVSALLLACQPIRPEAVVQADSGTNAAEEEAQLIEAALALEEAYQNEDLERVLAFYADDALSHAPGFPTDVGKEAIKTAYEAYFDAYDLQRDFQLAGVEVNGEYATRTGEWTQVLTPKDGGEPITEIGRCVLGWKKVNGEWKVVWEIWNTYKTQPE
jgi:ketosteroid isomerase-like protein